jgi:pyruvate kinase
LRKQNKKRQGMKKKRTKIVATISDRNCESGFIRELFEAGMDVIRINSAHLNIEGALRIIRNAREVSDKIAIIIDTKGPEIRTTVCDTPISVKKGKKFKIIGNPEKKTSGDTIYVTYKSFTSDIHVGSVIMFDDGEIEMKALKKEGDNLVCIAQNDGILGSRKSVNIPGVKVSLPSLTEKDKAFIEMAVQNDVDFIAHSFVRSRQDVLDVQAVLDKYNSEIKIIAKIENQEGVENFNDILESVYGIMVARGDLAIEIPYEKIPGIQRMMIERCIYSRKPVIVATQMLHSMINNPRPTRAEVSDIASAIYLQTDAMMLSGETASGIYPVEAVKTMTRVAIEVESNKEKFLDTPGLNIIGEISSYLAKVAVETSIRIAAKGIIADTIKGRTIRDMASYRGINLVLAQCYSLRTMRELALSYGVYASYQERRKSVDEFIHIALKNLTKAHDLRDDDLIVVLAGNFSGRSGFSFIEVGSVMYLKDLISIKEDQ